jgi:hypothetical protein
MPTSRGVLGASLERMSLLVQRFSVTSVVPTVTFAGSRWISERWRIGSGSALELFSGQGWTFIATTKARTVISDCSGGACGSATGTCNRSGDAVSRRGGLSKM